MEAVGYPELTGHRKQHQQLLRQTSDMEKRIEMGDGYTPADLDRFVQTCLIRHIQAPDKRFSDFMAARGA